MPEPQKAISDRLLENLGNAVLIPISAGQKAPSEREWQKRTTADMAAPAYVTKLNSGCNLGVVLGRPSGGLCTIDIDDDAMVEPFLDANPRLRDTLRTRRVRGCNIWLTVEGDYPPSAKLKSGGADFGEWRADGNQTVIYGEAIDRAKGETEPTRYQQVGDAGRPITMRFEDIVWPEAMELPWQLQATQTQAAELESRYGEALIGTKNPRPNEWFWAGLYESENHVLFEPDEGEFYHYNEGSGLWLQKTRAKLVHELSDRLLDASREMRFKPLAGKPTTAFLRRVADALQGIAERRDAFEGGSKIVHCANGVLQMAAGGGFDFCEFSPDFYSRNQSPIAFDETAACPRFIGELLVPAVSEDDAVLIQKYAGLCLLGTNLVQRFLILDGLPGRGKTQLALIIQMLVGQLNCCELRTEQLGERFEIGRFRKKTLLVGVDVPGNFLDGVFHSSLKLASAEGQRISVVEMLYKVAFKAQAQSAKTLESIAALRGGSAPPVLVAQQANVAGQQVVNNYASSTGQDELPPDECIVRSAKTEKAADQDHATLDDRGAPQAIPRHPDLEPVGEVHRPRDAGGERDGVAQRLQGRGAAKTEGSARGAEGAK